MNDSASASVTRCVSGQYPHLKEFQEQYSKLHGYIGLSVCCIGVLTNIANIIVLSQRAMQSSTNLLLRWLAVSDLCTMATFLPTYMHFYLFKQSNLAQFHTYSAMWIYYLLVQISGCIIFHSSSLWITIMVALFRYIYISWPLHGNQLCSIRNAKVAVASVYVFACVICIPNILYNEVGTNQTCTPSANVSTHLLTDSGDGNGNGNGENSQDQQANAQISSLLYVNRTRTIYCMSYSKSAALEKVNFWTQGIFIRFVPSVLLTLFTILLINEMRKAQLRRKKLKANEDRKHEQDANRTTLMLLSVVVIFLLVELTQGILSILNAAKECFYENVYMPLGDVIEIMTLANAAVYFILYTTMSKQFRDTFINLFWTVSLKKLLLSSLLRKSAGNNNSNAKTPTVRYSSVRSAEANNSSNRLVNNA